MSYHVTHWHGETEELFPLDQLERLLEELKSADDEHPDVSVTHETEWSIGVTRSGWVVFENLEEGEPMHLPGTDREQVLALMKEVALGQIERVLSRAWRPGYPPGKAT